MSYRKRYDRDMLKVPSVTNVIHEIKNLLEGEFRNISVNGEVSNLSRSASGHWYFTLSDSNSSLSCAMFRMDAMRNPLVKKLVDGDKIICNGRISVYQARGTFQLIVARMVHAGKGDLSIQFEFLKKKLSSEGLFDLEIKKKIPQYPENIAVITSENGAAIHDFINVFKRRSLWMNLLVVPALVQGDESPKSLRRALELLLAYNMQTGGKLDVIVFTRGGGSIEDLYAFNDEELARDIHACPVPVISAVGHQVDYTICDFVADFRSETPSSAAEVLTMGQMKLAERLKNTSNRMESVMDLKLMEKKHVLSGFDPGVMLGALWKRISWLKDRVERCSAIKNITELSGLFELMMKLDELMVRMTNRLDRHLDKSKSALDRGHNMLRVLDPKNVLGRGYTITAIPGDGIVHDKKAFDKVEIGSELEIVFCDGKGKIIKSKG
ncbi:MAG: exodeoxyribonuclease VII large subunit [Bacteriovoracaceae bacterium]|nr:exodeoxyribonuclease VII large subunit [Bacteriovoracaceae bacterium]